ncbi:hypothetical protein PGB90_000353 [Kerria lacca]
MRFASKSWHNVTKKKIVNCLRKCKFAVPSAKDSEDTNIRVVDEEAPTDWSKACEVLNVSDNVSFEDFVNMDVDALVTDFLTIDDIVEQISTKHEHDAAIEKEYDDDTTDLEFQEQPRVTRKDAMNSILNLHRYFETLSNVKPEVFHMLHDLDNVIDKSRTFKQFKITDYTQM